MALHSSPQQAWVAETFFVAISLGSVILRSYIRIHHFRRLSLADVATILAWLCLLFSALCDTCVKHMGLWDPKLDFKGGKEPDFPSLVPKEKLPDIISGLRILYASVPIFYTGFFAVKFAFLLQYYDYFPPFRRRLRLALNILCTIVLAGYLVSVVLNIFYCLPVERNWAMEMDRKCFSSIQLPVYGFTNVFHIVSDFAIYILPFWLLPSLLGMRSSNLGSPSPHRRRKRQELYSVITIFSLGFLCILLTMIRLICVGSSTSLSFFAAMSAAELSVAIAVSCSFTFKSGWDLFKARRRRRKSSTPTTESRRPSRTDHLRNGKKSKPNVRENFVGLEEGRQPQVVNSSSGGPSGSVAPHGDGSTGAGIESTIGKSYIDGIEDEEEGMAGPSLMVRREVPADDRIPKRAQVRPGGLGTGKRGSIGRPAVTSNRSSLKAIQEKNGFALSNMTFGDHDSE